MARSKLITDARIRDLLARGYMESTVATKLGMRIGELRSRMARLGIQAKERDVISFQVDQTWLTEDLGKRRQLIWRRQREGARATRAAAGAGRE